MKKIVLFVLLGALYQQVAFAERKVVLSDAKQLPPSSLQFIEKTFPKLPIYLVNVEKDGSDILSYGAVLTNGYYVEFNGEGKWRVVDCHREPVPVSVIPDAIKKYIDQEYDGELVISIDTDLNRSRVQLTSRRVIAFDPNFNFIRIDE